MARTVSGAMLAIDMSATLLCWCVSNGQVNTPATGCTCFLRAVAVSQSLSLANSQHSRLSPLLLLLLLLFRRRESV